MFFVKANNISKPTETLLWTNPSPASGMNASTLILDDDFTNYDYIAIEYTPSNDASYSGGLKKILIPVDDLAVKGSYSNAIGIGMVLANGTTESVRFINKVSGYTDRIYVSSSQLNINQGIPIYIYGVK